MKRLKRFKTPHKRYWKDVEVCYCVKDEYFKLTKDVTFDKRKIVSRVATDFNVNKKTLRGWINKWKTDISWMPFDTSNHGLFQDMMCRHVLHILSREMHQKLMKMFLKKLILLKRQFNR